MKVSFFAKYYILLTSIALLSAIGCAPERDGLVGNLYHNTTSRYNALFYANLRMEEIQLAIAEQEKDNYNKVLRVLPTPDTSLISSLDEQIEDCIKKASVAIERHPNSKWADDSYILVGQCRAYRQNFGDAINTFKFVNTESEDNAARHKALIHLMRTFIDANEQNNAVAVGDYLRKEKLNRENKVQFHLTKAHQAQLNDDEVAMIGNLLIAAPLTKKTEGRGKVYFILGQLYQKLGYNEQAYENYQQVLKSNPEYELYFYTRLNMAQVSDLSNEGDTKKIRKYFKKLLKDQKNEEYRDKIYYEMASFEQKQGDLEKAIEYYDKSVQASVSNNRQKAYSYLALGKIYYDEFSKYKLAKLYYDSTMSVLPQDEEQYAAIAQRQEVLTNFVEQLTVIETQDSLLALAEMDSLELTAFIDEIVETQRREQRAQERLERQQARREERVSNTSFGEVTSPFGEPGSEGLDASAQPGGADWYFYNPAALSGGQSDFIRRWGKRPLEDNWRRSNKTMDASFAPKDIENIDAVDSTLAFTEGAPDADASLGADEAMAGNAEREAMYADIPFTAEQKQASLALIEEAYFKLGGIYNFDLEEKRKAIEAFETMLERFPATEHEPEVLYELYLLYKELGDDQYLTYKNRLLEKFPESIFAKIIKNPNYREESNLANEQLKKLYKEAYDLYRQGQDSVAMIAIRSALRKYPETDFTDNMELLQILVSAKTSTEAQYQLALQKFIEANPESDVRAYAEELLAGISGLKERLEALRGTQFIPEFNERHSFIVVYENVKKLSTVLPKVIEAFNQQYFAGQSLTTANLMLEDGKVMVLVESFPNQDQALVYYQKFNGEDSPLKNLSEEYDSESIDTSFVITEDNLPILYRTKDVDQYLQFFQKHYIE